jgi:hypothetical protein
VWHHGSFGSIIGIVAIINRAGGIGGSTAAWNSNRCTPIALKAEQTVGTIRIVITIALALFTGQGRCGTDGGEW